LDDQPPNRGDPRCFWPSTPTAAGWNGTRTRNRSSCWPTGAVQDRPGRRQARHDLFPREMTSTWRRAPGLSSSNVWRRTNDTFYTAASMASTGRRMKTAYERHLPRHRRTATTFAELLSEMLASSTSATAGPLYELPAERRRHRLARHSFPIRLLRGSGSRSTK